MLDLRTISPDIVRAHFPAIVRRCAEEGYDVFNAPIPVVPGQHYFMGGVKSDLEGKTSMSRCSRWGRPAATACTAKIVSPPISLLESLVFAKRAALRIANTYEPLSDDVKKRTVQGFDEREYQDKKGLAERYKKSVLSEIEKEKEQKETMNPITQKLQADKLIRMALEEDITSEDVSTNAVMPDYKKGKVQLLCKQDGVICGLGVF